MLKVDQQKKDLGKLSYGEPHEFDFKLTNIGENVIVITKMVKSCAACTEASIQKRYINPKESIDMHVKFTPGSTGKTKKEIQILYITGNLPPQNMKVEFKAVVE